MQLPLHPFMRIIIHHFRQSRSRSLGTEGETGSNAGVGYIIAGTIELGPG